MLLIRFFGTYSFPSMKSLPRYVRSSVRHLLEEMCSTVFATYKSQTSQEILSIAFPMYQLSWWHAQVQRLKELFVRKLLMSPTANMCIRHHHQPGSCSRKISGWIVRPRVGSSNNVPKSLTCKVRIHVKVEIYFDLLEVHTALSKMIFTNYTLLSWYRNILSIRQVFAYTRNSKNATVIVA